jgi:hypothetical protein
MPTAARRTQRACRETSIPQAEHARRAPVNV